MNFSSITASPRELKPFDALILSTDPRFSLIKYQFLRYYEDGQQQL